MAEQGHDEPPGTQKQLLDSLLDLGSRAFDPGATGTATPKQQFSDLVKRTPPVALIPALNILIRPGQAPEWLRAEFMSALALVPLRPDGGVRAALEFVFSVHPSSQPDPAGSSAQAPQTQGASITHEALNMAARLLASPPARTTPEAWFRGIAGQLLALLDGHDGLELARVASYVIGFGILGRRSFGAPGTPGWTCFAEPMLRAVDPTGKDRTGPDSGIVELQRNATGQVSSSSTLVPAADVSQGLRRLQTLVISHPNPGLTRRLLGPVLLPLWALSSWPKPSAHLQEQYCLPARNLLKIYLNISTAPDKAMPIVRNLLFDGSHDAGKAQWAYQARGDGICIVSTTVTPDPAEILQSKWTEIGPKSDALLDLLGEISSSDDDISGIFLDLFSRWLSGRRREQKPKPGIVLIKEQDVPDADPLSEVLQGSILQKMMQRFPEKLAGRPGQILELVEGLLGQTDEATLGEDDSIPTVLSLLNLVVTSPGFRRASASPELLQSIEASLDKVSRHADDETAKTAQNLLLFIKYRDEIEEDDETRPVSNTSRTEDRKTHSLAMSYIMTADSPPPVRSEGLSLLQGLVQKNSPVLDIPALLVLLSSLLDESEDYVNLRVIKLFTLVANRHPQSTAKELLDSYVDASETKKVDTRLRFGEALLQVVERLGETFTGELAQKVGQALLEIAGRRGFRAKTKAKQEREERMNKMRNKSTDEPEEDKDQDTDDEDPSEKERNAVLGSIVDGWQSKRGSEDVRIRASALSILATAIDTNVAGLGAALTSAAVDLCLHVLTLEPELEKGILRRAAIVLILSFVKALGAARETRRHLGFGLTDDSQADILRILRYVASADEDGLVKEHALDVIESLENHKAASLIPAESERQAGLGLGGLAGLSINPDRLSLEPGSRRPRIEEIE